MGVADDPRHVGVQIHLGGKDRTLRYTIKTQRLIKGIDNGRNPNGEGGLLRRIHEEDPDDVALLFWAMLYNEDPRPSLDDVSDWLDLIDVEGLWAKVAEVQGKNNRAAEPDAPPP